MGEILRKFEDGSILKRDKGRFDDWCIYLDDKPPLDVDYFRVLREFDEKYGNGKVYSDFCQVYDKTNNQIEQNVFDLIDELSKTYNMGNNDSLIINKIFSILYVAMMAEENKANTKLGKRIKRLGVHCVLKETMDISQAANFMKGKKWREIDSMCKQRGF